jgi:hypothetical protein
MSKFILSLIAAALLGCGVKGPPEPPLPTEGSLKKDMQEPQIVPAEPTPAPVPPKKGKKSSKAKAQ